METEKKADELFKKFWAWRLKDSPEFATIIGVHTYDDKMQSYTLKSFENRKATIEFFFDEAKILLSDVNIGVETKTNLELLKYELQLYLTGMEAKGYLFPINDMEGIHLEFKRLLSLMPQETLNDFRNIIARFKALRQQISEIIVLMRRGIDLDMTYHQVSVEKLPAQLDAILKEPEESFFYEPFLTIPDSITSSEKNDLRSEALNIISEHVLPSFKELLTFFKDEYFNHLRKDIAITSLPNGQKFYDLCLTFHLGFEISFEDIHTAGLNEVQRISEEMKKVIDLLGYKMTIAEFAEFLRKDEQFYFSSKKELLEDYDKLVFHKIKPKLQPKFFKKMPKTKLVIQPDHPSGIAAYYLAGSSDGKHPATFYVCTEDLKATPKYDMATLALHEALPGHHLQVSFMMEKTNIPSFRREIEDRKYSEAPSRFPLHSTFVEGWALYCEYLGYELGLYEDLYSRYGHLSYEMIRSCRLVVDTGMHAMGWSRDKAIDYMLEHTASHRKSIETEINRYITWPGQACAYKIGEMKIKHLRKHAEKELGNSFHIHEFHEEVLQSSGPLYFLEQRINSYIEKRSCKCCAMKNCFDYH